MQKLVVPPDDSFADFEPEGVKNPSGLECLVIVARRHGLHLSVPQLVRDNVLNSPELSSAELVKCAQSVGLKAKIVQLGWNDLSSLDKALPAVVRLKSGECMVLVRIEGDGDNACVVLQDPLAEEDQLLPLDRVRFEQAWTGEVALIKRDYEITDEAQPFSLGLIMGLVFRERWIVRDVALCALVLGFLALSPIVFWRVMSDRVIYYQAFNTFYVVCLGFLLLLSFEVVFFWLRRYLLLHLTTRIDVKLSTYVFDKILNLPMDFFERTAVGKITHDVQQLWKIRTFLTGQLFGTVLDSTTLLIFLPLMFFFSPVMTVVVLAFCGLIVLWLILMLPSYRRKSNSAEQADAVRGASLVQTIHGIRTVKSLSLNARQRHQWDVHVAHSAKMRFAEGMAGNAIQAVVLPLERLAITGSFALGVYIAITSKDPVYIGALFAFLMLSQRVAGPLMQMAQLVNQYGEARIAVDVVRQLINQPAEEGRGSHGVRVPIRGQIEFTGVTCKYKGTSFPALDRVSLDVPQGSVLGIMGRSGSGKTTITRLLQRLHSDYQGLIKIDGIDVREYNVDYLRQTLGVVLQDNFLFSGTIRENIAAAKPDATFDDVVRAARLAGAEEFIDKLPRGYETYIYEGSQNLSGGQRQRLAIARALIVDPRILILDEATSALDPESEAIISENLTRIAHGRTLIVVSHRLASLVSSDAIAVLDGGRLIDIGRHQDLLDRCDVYGRLWHQQNSHLVTAVQRSKSRNPSLVS